MHINMSHLRLAILNIRKEDRRYRMFCHKPILEETLPNSSTKILELICPNVYCTLQETQLEKQYPYFNEAVIILRILLELLLETLESISNSQIWYQKILVKNKMVKENIMANFHSLGFGNDFFTVTPKI